MSGSGAGGGGGGPVVGIDLGATKTTVAVVDEDGAIASPLTAATPAGAGARAVLEATAALIAEVRAQARDRGAADPMAVGIGAAGVIDAAGVVTRATDHIAGWAGTALADELAARTGLPVRALNDVHAHALGEARLGAGRGCEVVLALAVGSGVGGAVVVGGSVLRGAHGAAGHLGHVPCEEAAGLPCPCGRVGHLEALASGPGLLADHRRRGGVADDLAGVFALAGDGDPRALETVAVGAQALGRALGGAINALDPDVVIVTGGVARAGGEWWSQMERAALGELPGPPCPIVAPATGTMSAVLGAAAYARGETRA